MSQEQSKKGQQAKDQQQEAPKKVQDGGVQSPKNLLGKIDAAVAASKAEETAAKIEVLSGSNVGEFAVVGKKVAEVRSELTDAFNIHAAAQTYVNGNEVQGDYVIKQGDVLEFIRATGVKG